ALPGRCPNLVRRRAGGVAGVGRGMIKQAGIVAWLMGLVALIAITAWPGVDAVGHAVASVGWGILFVVMVRAVPVSVAGMGWWLLFPPKARPQPSTCISLRFVREATNTLLPLAQVGGDFIGAGLLTTLYAVPGTLSVASVIVDVLLQAATQFLFAIVGLLVLITLAGDTTIVLAAALGIGIAGMLLLGFYFAQRRAGQPILHLGTSRFTGDRKWGAAAIDGIYHNLSTIYAARSDLVASFVVHMIGWIVGV